MNTPLLKRVSLTIAMTLLAGGALFAQQITQDGAADVVVPYADENAAAGTEIIFSNLGPAGDLYNAISDFALPIAGKSVPGVTEEWEAALFTPTVHARAKVLLAAIGRSAGASRIKLGIYANDRFTGSVGQLLPGGEGSTAQIPAADSCCQLARVALPGDGVELKPGTPYWLVASTDDVNAPSFNGGWRLSNITDIASFLPPSPWITSHASWPAAQIRGTRVQSDGVAQTTNGEVAAEQGKAPDSTDVVIFSNLGPTPNKLYNSFAGGIYVAGNSAFDTSEVWRGISFTAKRDFHAITLSAAVGYVVGTKMMNLGIYSDNGGTVGTLLPGGQGSTSEIPAFGQCCGLAQVTLPGTGVALAAGTRYWLVASPDDVNAPDFEGLWQGSNFAANAYTEPENFTNWTSVTGAWLAAEVSGTSP